MDIKVGNDIRLNVTLPEYIDPSTILKITAVFSRGCMHGHHHHAHHYFYYPSQYTLHGHSHGCYNVLPHNVVCHPYECDAYCGHHDHGHRNRIVAVKPTGLNTFTTWFSNTTIHDCGEYCLTVNIQAYEDGWDCDNVHEYTVYYGPVFSISNDSDALEGSITLNISKGGLTPDNPDPEVSVLLYNDGTQVLYNDSTYILLNN